MLKLLIENFRNLKNKPDYRLIYIGYLILFVLAALYFNRNGDFTKDLQSTTSYIANVSELLGLAIALTEIFALHSLTKRLKKSLNSLQSYSDISNISVFLSQTKDDILSNKYGRALLRLENIKNVYHENIPLTELSITTSIHRRNYDQLNSIINKLQFAEVNFSRRISASDMEECVTFLTSFNETLTSLKLTFKNDII